MCRPGNGTIFKECREAILKAKGQTSMSNQEMRRIIGKHGCLIDKKAG